MSGGRGPWRLPLWQDYAKDLQGKVADLTNIVNLTFGPAKMAGAIFAALFMLQEKLAA